MTEKKKEEPIKKLEKEFREFQKQWIKFLTNDFRHLVVNVDTLIKQNDEMRQSMGKDIQTLKNCVTSIDHNIITLLERVK